MSFPLWFRRVVTIFYEKSPSMYAACSVFYILISIIPTSAFLLSILRYVPEVYIFLLNQLFLIIPAPLHPSFAQFFLKIVHSSTPAVLSISGLVSLWSSSKGIQTVMNGLKYMMDIQTTGNWVQRRVRAMAAFLLCIVFLTIMAGVFIVINYFFHSFTKCLLPILLLFPIMVFVLYRWQSYGQISYGACVMSASVASLAVFVYSYIYGIYIRLFSSYDDFWGNLGAVVLGMMWIHGLFVIILIGSRLAKQLSEENS